MLSMGWQKRVADNPLIKLEMISNRHLENVVKSGLERYPYEGCEAAPRGCV
jgi:hypothetical protein